uniref:Uncharacterized protein n=1 Tax=Zooxanthella nutricula TaxID=1333877 RepID=A0A7S2IU14_9DINO
MAAGFLELDLLSFIHVSAGIWKGGARQVSEASEGCPIASDFPATFFLLPPCPAHAQHCDDAEVECSREEAATPGHCKCTFGYEGAIGFDPDVNAREYQGNCTPIEAYCKAEGKLSHENGYMEARVREEAQPQCEDGLRPMGAAECMTVNHTVGVFDSGTKPYCEFLHPNRPVLIACPLPSEEDFLFSEDLCWDCTPGDKCECDPRCHEGFGDARSTSDVGGALPSPRCVRQVVACPDGSQLEWSEGACFSNGTKTHKFCCDEAWTGSGGDRKPKLPPLDLHSAACEESVGALECFQRQASEGDLCCWNQSGWALALGHSPQCASLGALESEGKKVDSDTQCAIRREVSEAVWVDMPQCAKYASPPPEMPGLRIQGGRECLPGRTCAAHVQCEEGYVLLGGKEGLRQFESDGSGGLKFVGEPPLCVPRPLSPLCGDVPDGNGTLRWSGECKDCRAGEWCACVVRCAENHTEGDGVATRAGTKTCKPLPLDDVQSCSTLTQARCLLSKEGHNGQDHPCCLLHNGECEVRGSPRITESRLPLGFDSTKPLNICAQHETVWEDLPQCQKVSKGTCEFRDDSVLWRFNLSAECQSCTPGEDCNCKVSCHPKLDMYGAMGPDDTISCTEETKLFPDLPACLDREAAPECRWEEPTTGLKGLRPHAEHIMTNCQVCPVGIAGESCCTAKCAAGYLRADFEEKESASEINCKESPRTDFRFDSCEEAETFEDCMDAAEGPQGHSERVPCCWSGGDGGKCLAKGRSEWTMENLPQACSRVRKAEYEGFPECKAVCSLPGTGEWDLQKSVNCARVEHTRTGTYQIKRSMGVVLHKEFMGRATQERFRKHAQVYVNETRVSADFSELWGWAREGHPDRRAGWIKIVEPLAKHMEYTMVHAIKVALTAEETEALDSPPDDKVCNAQCKRVNGGPWYIPRGEPPEGLRACVVEYETNLVRFPPLPRCEQTCATPDDKQGTLRIDGCEQCFAEREDADRRFIFRRDRCHCEVFCDPRTKLRTGYQGPKKCEKHPHVARPYFSALPTCSPFCSPPDSQDGKLDVSECKYTCLANDPSCRCKLRCASGLAPLPRSTPFECKTTISSAGQATTQWVQATRAGTPGIPTCAKPFVVTVVDAQTKALVYNARVEIFDGYIIEDSRRRFDATTASRGDHAGKVECTTPYMEYMMVRVSKDGYFQDTIPKDRAVDCAGVKADCYLQVALQKKGSMKTEIEVENGECFLSAENPGQHAFTAVLTWSLRPVKDLDIWARSWDCAVDVAKRYNCGVGKKWLNEARYSNRPPACMRSDFFDRADGLSSSEARSCTVSRVASDYDYYSGTTTTRMDANGMPIISGLAQNQFPKWVNYKTRHVSKLTRRLLGKSPHRGVSQGLWDNLKNWWSTASKPYEDWKIPEVISQRRPGDNDGYMILDVDAQNGLGPETVSFNKVPPGRYQIAVNSWSREKPIEEASPRVKINIGNGYFVCQIKHCDQSQHVWNVANVVFGEGEVKDGRTRHKFQIVDRPGHMIPLYQTSLSTDPDKQKWEALKRDADTYRYAYWEAHMAPPPYGPLDEELEASCHGICEPGHPEHRACLMRNDLPLEWVQRAASFALPEPLSRDLTGATLTLTAPFGALDDFSVALRDAGNQTLYTFKVLMTKGSIELSHGRWPKRWEFPRHKFPRGMPFDFVFRLEHIHKYLPCVNQSIWVSGARVWHHGCEATDWTRWASFMLDGSVPQTVLDFQKPRKPTTVCKTRCHADECMAFNGNTTCWAKRRITRWSSKTPPGSYSARANNCFTKHTATHDGWCWDQKEVTAGLECCTGRAGAPEYDHKMGRCRFLGATEEQSRKWHQKWYGDGSAGRLKAMCDRSERCLGYSKSFVGDDDGTGTGWLYYAGSAWTLGVESTTAELDLFECNIKKAQE